MFSFAETNQLQLKKNLLSGYVEKNLLYFSFFKLIYFFLNLGSKWITNKWIRWYTQALTFPCDIDRRSRKRLKPLANNIHSFLPHGRTNLLPFDKLLAREVRRLKN
jgi:hypothetical protein